MVQIIAGKKGKGKTKHLLDKANAAITEAKGSIVYLDKSSKHMYELSNKIVQGLLVLFLELFPRIMIWK